MTNSPRPKRAKKTAFKEIESAMKENFAPFDFKFKKRDYTFTPKQKKLIDQILDPEIKIVFIDGVAGTSKSLVSVYCGLSMLKEKKTHKMLYMRSVVESAQKGLGFLKGTLSEKMEIWRHVLDSKCEELIEGADLQKVMSSGKLEALPINYIRGASWKDMFVVLDECQNLDYDAYKLVLSRIGENTKLIICGDSDQSDIRDSGFKRIFKMFDNEDAREMGIVSFSFEESDIVRSELCKFIVKTFREEKE